MSKKQQGNEQLLGTVQLLCSGSNLVAPLNGARRLSKVQHSQVGVRVPDGIANERPRNGFRAGHPEVVDVVSGGGVREIAIDHTLREIRTVPCDSVKVIFIGRGIKLRDQFLIL